MIHAETLPHLRRNNRIQSIHSSLKIEANSLSLAQVKDVIGGKPVLGEPKEIQEVKNAYAAYELLRERNENMKDNTNKKYWERVAKLYAPLMERDKQFYADICDDIEPFLNPNMEVLELACGPGCLSFSLSSKVSKWLATDYSEKMIAEAKKREQKTNLHFEVADATQLQFEAESFDGVVIANALHIMPFPDKALEEIHRVLKPQGLLCAPTFLWAEGKTNRIRKELMRLSGFQLYKEWDQKSFVTFVESFGFETKQIHLIDGGMAPVGVLIAYKK